MMPPLQKADARDQALFPHSAEPRSIGELLGKLSAETGMLIRQEMNLSAIELKEKASAASKHALLIAVGTVVCSVSLMTLTAAAVVGLSTLMALWLSALIVGTALGGVGYGVVRMGAQALRHMSPTPAKAIASWKENKAWAQTLVR
jgi:uncharacterized membrane protein YqjE